MKWNVTSLCLLLESKLALLRFNDALKLKKIYIILIFSFVPNIF